MMTTFDEKLAAYREARKVENESFATYERQHALATKIKKELVAEGFGRDFLLGLARSAGPWRIRHVRDDSLALMVDIDAERFISHDDVPTIDEDNVSISIAGGYTLYLTGTGKDVLAFMEKHGLKVDPASIVAQLVVQERRWNAVRYLSTVAFEDPDALRDDPDEDPEP
jgi:hypothetical protein